jgi:hypothetical protein
MIGADTTFLEEMRMAAIRAALVEGENSSLSSAFDVE